MATTSHDSSPSPTRDSEAGLTTKILIALVLGVLVGWMFPPVATALSFIGDIFMAALKMLIMPLIVFTMIVGVASLGTPQELGRLGSRAILYYFSTTALAIIVGIIVVNAMKPGHTPIPGYLSTAVVTSIPTRGKVNTKHQGLIRSAFEQYLMPQPGQLTADQKKRAKTLALLSTHAIYQAARQAPKGTNQQRFALNSIRAEMLISRVGMRRGIKEAQKIRKHSQKKGPPLTVSRFLRMQITKILQNPFKSLATGNVLGIIVFSIALGLILVTMGPAGRPVITLSESLNEAMMRFVEIVMKMTPIGVFSLMAHQIARSGLDILFLLGKYMICVLIALGIHAFIVLPLILLIAGRRSPFTFFGDVRAALGIAFSTSSSSATLPVSMDVVENNAGVKKHVSGFVLPLGATINMDGTALYEAIAALFIAQIYGIDLGIGPQILIFMTAALAAIGAAGIPSAGTVTMVMVLSAVGLPLSGIGLILAVDRLLDMCRTTVNVWGDAIGAAILDRYETEPEPETT